MKASEVIRGLAVLMATGAAGAAAPGGGGVDPGAPQNVLAREVLKELVEINTTDSVGSVTRAAEAMAKRLIDAGYPAADVQVLGPSERKKNLVVRLHGTGRHPPVLLIGHLDVVEARREDWTTDPFQLVEQDGYFYGRGTLDMKDGDAIMVTTLIRLKKEGFKPSRDIILALTADEEGGPSNGVAWLLSSHRELVDAQLVLNHDGYSVIENHGKPVFYELDASEKVYADYQLTVTNPGGHSSLPVPDNAIYELAQGLMRLQTHEFPLELNHVTQGYYEQMATIETGERAADMQAILATQPDPAAVRRLSRDAFDHSIQRTTCVPTTLAGGHANNALPQMARANVNCRILPGHSPEEVRQDLIKVLAEPKIVVRYVADDGKVFDTGPDRRGYEPPPLDPQVMKPLQALVGQMWPGLRIVPTMSTGASDGVYTMAAGLPTYTVTGVAVERSDVRMHGKDERVGVESYYRGNEFFYRYLRAVTAR
jgi:acetylornithine deacetylase/succinyl-diaminopimelate desuccinylase-like protein